jgi:hypothetical protein
MERKGNEDRVDGSIFRYSNDVKELITTGATLEVCSWPDCLGFAVYRLRPCPHSLCLMHVHHLLDSITVGIGVTFEQVDT